MTHEEDLKAKVHELFAQVAEQLDPQLEKMIESGCGIVDDHAKCDGYLVAKAFLCAFLQQAWRNGESYYIDTRVHVSRVLRKKFKQGNREATEK